MKNLFFIPLIMGVGVGVCSCNFGNSGNYENFSTPAVVSYKEDMGGTVIGTPIGFLATPSINDVFKGDCIYIVDALLDYDNQPSDKYLTATNIVKENVDQSYLEIRETNDLENYNLPISDLYAAPAMSEFFMGRIFVYPICKDKNPSFRLIYNSIEEEFNGIKNLYLQARPSASSESNEYVSISAFNLSDFVNSQGIDTTITMAGTSEKVEYKYMKVNLKYPSNISKDGIPEYSTYAGPYTIFMFKN